jgi:hypothetical protein
MKSFTQTMAVGSKPESAAGERARVDVRMVVELVDRPEDAGALAGIAGERGSS